MNKKQKTQKIVAAAVMGMNLVNSLSPMALTMQKCNELAVAPQPVQPQTEAQPLEYTVLPQVLQDVESFIFSTAEAEEIIVNSSDSKFEWTISSGTQMIVNAGNGGAYEVLSGGTQIVNDGIGTATYFSSGARSLVEAQAVQDKF